MKEKRCWVKENICKEIGSLTWWCVKCSLKPRTARWLSFFFLRLSLFYAWTITVCFSNFLALDFQSQCRTGYPYSRDLKTKRYYILLVEKSWWFSVAERTKLKSLTMNLRIFKYNSNLPFKPNPYSFSFPNNNANSPTHWIFLVFFNDSTYL